MPPPVYSVEALSGVLPLNSIATPTYAVPAGMRFILRDIAGWVSNIGPDVGGITFYKLLNPIVYNLDVPPGVSLSYNWSGRVVIDNPQELLCGVYGNSGEAHFVASGYLLTLP
jgi:hypothetical protein